MLVYQRLSDLCPRRILLLLCCCRVLAPLCQIQAYPEGTTKMIICEPMRRPQCFRILIHLKHSHIFFPHPCPYMILNYFSFTTHSLDLVQHRICSLERALTSLSNDKICLNPLAFSFLVLFKLLFNSLPFQTHPYGGLYYWVDDLAHSHCR